MIWFIFERKARFYIPAEGVDEDELTLNLIDAGAEEVERKEELFEVFGPVDSFGASKTNVMSSSGNVYFEQ